MKQKYTKQFAIPCTIDGNIITPRINDIFNANYFSIFQQEDVVSLEIQSVPGLSYQIDDYVGWIDNTGILEWDIESYGTIQSFKILQMPLLNCLPSNYPNISYILITIQYYHK